MYLKGWKACLFIKTQGIERSYYLKEKRSIEIALVAESESAIAKSK